MEIILAIVVGLAVIFFGALISMGNERQRKAIDALREQTELWAVQDIKIKRERQVRDVRIDDPLTWLTKITAKVFGYDLNLKIIEVFEDPRALVCESGDSTGKIVISPLSPSEIRKLKCNRRSRLSQYVIQNPLLALPRNVTFQEASVLNCGFMFDLELRIAWKGLTGQTADQMEQLWMYIII